MPKILRNFPKPLNIPQIRVLQVLAKVGTGGALSRSAISDACGNKTGVVVGRAVGYTDPDKRFVFEQTKDGGGSPGHPFPSLLTRGYVKEIDLQTDLGSELGIQITEAGLAAFNALGPVNLPPLQASDSE